MTPSKEVLSNLPLAQEAENNLRDKDIARALWYIEYPANFLQYEHKYANASATKMALGRVFESICAFIGNYIRMDVHFIFEFAYYALHIFKISSCFVPNMY